MIMMVPRVPRCTQQYASLLQVIIKQIILVLLSTSACGDPVFLLLVRAFKILFSKSDLEVGLSPVPRCCSVT